MCDMQFGTIECRGDGYLWDSDFDGYDLEDTFVYEEDREDYDESELKWFIEIA